MVGQRNFSINMNKHSVHTRSIEDKASDFNQCYFISYFTDAHRVERRRMLNKAVQWAVDKDFDVTIIASN